LLAIERRRRRAWSPWPKNIPKKCDFSSFGQSRSIVVARGELMRGIR
jgi:hypothetical protein